MNFPLPAIDNPYDASMLNFIIFFLFIPSAFSFDTLSFDLTSFNEEEYLEHNPGPHLLPLAGQEHPYDSEKEPLILVHGIRGQPSDLQNVAELFIKSRYQLYVLVYDDFKQRASINGELFAGLIRKLNHQSITIVAHSMGGIVTRKALADLVENRELTPDMQINFFSIDTPWHGFNGPADDELYGIKMDIARFFLPDGLEDMRAKSDMFKKLNRVKFPSNIKVHISFAEEGEEAWDYTEGFQDDFQEKNFHEALKLTGKFKLAYPDNLEAYYPRFPGNHVTVLERNHLRYSFLDYLKDQLL